jgi:hypothetical protein
MERQLKAGELLLAELIRSGIAAPLAAPPAPAPAGPDPMAMVAAAQALADRARGRARDRVNGLAA